MPVFLIMYMTASVIAVFLESTMNFKLFAKRKEVVEGEQKETMIQSMKAGLSYLRLQPIMMKIIWISLSINFLFGAFMVGYSFILIEKLKMELATFWIHRRGICGRNVTHVHLLISEKRSEVSAVGR